MNIIEEDGCFRGDVDHQYKVSELIELLQFMKEKYGDCTVLVEDITERYAAGFCEMYFVSNEAVRKEYPDDDIDDEVRILF